MTLVLPLIEAAFRAMLLGASVWLLLRLWRLRDAPSETLIWTVVLAAAIAMPLLTPILARLAALAFTLPRLSPVSATTLNDNGPGSGAPEASWLAAHGAALLWTCYGSGAVLCLSRLAAGLALTHRLYRAAKPVTAPWAEGRAIRASVRIAGPFTFGTCILLPADYTAWPEAKLSAVLAHENSHVQRGDFFLQLLAALYRAFFWFSPFAWWLHARLSALAEIASDEAAVRRLNDRARYAEILVEISCHARGIPAQVAMARGPGIAWRVERILDETSPAKNLGSRSRLAAAAAVLPISLAFAGAHAAVPSRDEVGIVSAELVQQVALGPSRRLVLPGQVTAARASHPIRRRAARKPSEAPAATAPDAISYNPRALLDASAEIFPVIVITDGGQ